MTNNNGNASAFTVAENKRREALKTLQNSHRAAFDEQDKLDGYEESLDLSGLPAETSFELGIIDAQIDSLGMMTSTPVMSLMRENERAKNKWGIGDNTRWNVGRLIPKLTIQGNAVFDINCGKNHIGPMWLDGVSTTVSIDLQFSKSIGDKIETLEKPYLRRSICAPAMFVVTNSLRFQKNYVNREKQTFIGLPKGTIIPFSQGGSVTVVRRYISSTTNSTRQATEGLPKYACLLVKTSDRTVKSALRKASKVVEEQRPHDEANQDMAYFIVGANLMIGMSTAHRFLIDRIKVPFISPLNEMNFAVDASPTNKEFIESMVNQLPNSDGLFDVGDVGSSGFKIRLLSAEEIEASLMM